MAEIDLDTSVLRTLLTAHLLGGFGRAAVRIGRSQSAVSQQLRRVEEQLGERLFRKQGRTLVPTEAGEVLIAYARRLVGLNDEAVQAVRGHALAGTVRFGLPADFAEAWLPAALGRFNRTHPAVRIEAVIDRNRKLLERLDAGELDLVLALAGAGRADAHQVATLPHVWIGPRLAGPARAPGEPVPLAVFEAPCFFRQAAIASLERAGIPWRVAFVSPSLHGLWAAVEAGLGVTLRTPVGLPPGVKVLGGGALPRVTEPRLPVTLHDGRRAPGPVAAELRAIVVDELTRRLAEELGAAAPSRRGRGARRPASGRRRQKPR